MRSLPRQVGSRTLFYAHWANMKELDKCIETYSICLNEKQIIVRVQIIGLCEWRDHFINSQPA